MVADCYPTLASEGDRKPYDKFLEADCIFGYNNKIINQIFFSDNQLVSFLSKQIRKPCSSLVGIGERVVFYQRNAKKALWWRWVGDSLNRAFGADKDLLLDEAQICRRPLLARDALPAHQLFYPVMPYRWTPQRINVALCGFT